MFELEIQIWSKYSPVPWVPYSKFYLAMGSLFTTIPYILNCVNKLTVVDLFRWNVNQCERMCLLFKSMMFHVANKHREYVPWQRFQLWFPNSVHQILYKDDHVKRGYNKNCQHIVSVCSLLRFYLFFLNLGIFLFKKLVWNALSSQKTFHMYKVHRQVKLDKTLLHCLNNSPLANVLFLFCNYYRWTS